MGSCLTAGMCCCFQCCCTELADGFRKWLGMEKVTKIFYFFLVVVFAVPAIFVFFFLNRWDTFINYFSQWIYCPATTGSDR